MLDFVFVKEGYFIGLNYVLFFDGFDLFYKDSGGIYRIDSLYPQHSMDSGGYQESKYSPTPPHILIVVS